MLNLPQVTGLLSDEHFSIDGTLIKAWASMKSFRRKDGHDELAAPGRNGERNFRGVKQSNEDASHTRPPTRTRGWRGSPVAMRRSWALPGTC